MHRVLLLSSMLLVACGAAPQEATDAAAAAPATAPAPRLDFPAKMRIPVQLDLLAEADGGRSSALPRAWRGEVEFDGGARSRCAIDRGTGAELEPGTRHEVRLLCTRPMQLPADGRRGLRVFEEGRVVATGAVLP